MEDLIDTPIFHTPVANEFWMGCPKGDLLIGQFEKSRIEMGLDEIGAELIEGSILLPRPGGDWCPKMLENIKQSASDTLWSLLETNISYITH